MKLHRAVWILVALHFVLALVYAWITPYREGGVLIHQGRAYAADIGAPDERQHVNYISHLASGKGFPVFDPKDLNLYESYQSHQPPLFYLMASTATLMHQPFSGPRSEGVEAYFGDSSTGRFLRAQNALIGSLTVLGVFCFVLWGFRRDAAALAAAAIAALLPMNVALSGAVSNDPLLFCLCTWTLAWAAGGIRDGWTVKVALATGLFMGLAFLTKTTSVALWPAVALGLYSARNASTPQRPNVLITCAVLALPLLIGAPWWLRNVSLYGDPFAMKAFTDAFQGSPQAAVFIQAGGPLDYWITGAVTGTGVLWWTLRSFFGVFGYMDIFLSNSVYAALALAILILLVTAALKGRKALDADRSDQSDRSSQPKSKSKPQTPNSKPQTAPSLAVSIMGGIFFFIVLALFLRFNAQYFQGQARYILPAIAPIAATLGIGAVALFRDKAPWVVAAMFLALNAYVLSILPEEFRIRVEGAPRTSGTSRALERVVSGVHASKSEVSWL